MLDGNTYCVEKHQHDDEPVEPLRLHRVPDPKTKPLLRPPEVRAFPNRSRLAFQETCDSE